LLLSWGKLFSLPLAGTLAILLFSLELSAAQPAFGENDSSTTTPTVTTTPPSIDLGYQLVGTTGSQVIEKVTNSGTLPLVITDISVNGGKRRDFIPSYSFTLPATVTPGNSVAINLAFSPTLPWKPGTRSARLVISEKNDSQYVPLTGIGANCGGPLPACSSGCADADGDGLNDAWEIARGVDLNNDGKIDAQNDLLLPGADPNKPDIFVRYDWMDYGLDGESCGTDTDCGLNLGTYHLGETCPQQGALAGQCAYACSTDSDCTSRWPAEAHAGERCISNVCEHTHDPLVLDANAFQLVIARFAAHGINLHILRGNPQPHSHVLSFRNDADMDLSCEGASVGALTAGFGKSGAESFYDLKPRGNPDKLNLAYHYVVFAHYSGCDSFAHCPVNAPNISDCPYRLMSFGQAGLAELSGNDFMVSMGSVVNDNGISPRFQVPVTFMHELGHNLGLHHDGHLDQPCRGGAGCPTDDRCMELGDGQGPVCHQTVNGSLGAEEPNYKPNYISIMNYLYEGSFIQMGASVGSRVPLGCASNSDCGGNDAFCALKDSPGSHCSISGRICTSNSDCTTAGDSCVPPRVPPHTCSTTGYVCVTDADCTAGDSCVQPSPGYCARMDYSRQTLPIASTTPGALDESNLDDTAGLGSGTSDLFSYTDALCHFCTLTAPSTGVVDWTGNGIHENALCDLRLVGSESFTDTGVQADIDAGIGSCDSGPHDVLHGHTDWPDLSGIQFNYKFQCTPNGAT
jgi:hypothetical protein